MRQYHRWLSIVFGVFVLWIAVTGVLSQIGSLVNNGGFERESAERGQRQAVAVRDALVAPARAHDHDEEDAAPAAAPATGPTASAPGVSASFVCPATMTCRPRPAPDKWNVGFLHHIHSGEQFGPLGTIISILSGLALIFFAGSGLWMYWQLWQSRRERRLPGGKWFW